MFSGRPLTSISPRASTIASKLSLTTRTSPLPRTTPFFLKVHQYQSRPMSSSAGTKYEWLVVVPDKPGTLAKRLEVRPTHFANLDPKVESGLFKMGGAILTEVPKDDKPESMKFCGSTLVVVAESREEVMEALKKDIYSESGVWDLDSAQIWPFKCAFRNP